MLHCVRCYNVLQLRGKFWWILADGVLATVSVCQWRHAPWANSQEGLACMCRGSQYAVNPNASFYTPWWRIGWRIMIILGVIDSAVSSSSWLGAILCWAEIRNMHVSKNEIILPVLQSDNRGRLTLLQKFVGIILALSHVTLCGAVWHWEIGTVLGLCVTCSTTTKTNSA